MKSSAKKIELASVDDLFSTEEGRQDAKLLGQLFFEYNLLGGLYNGKSKRRAER